jgi:alkylation response protein AidB-like acyl-CoA dehydrogenase
VDGHWVLNGQKVWASHALHSQRSFLLARTDPDAPTHHGIGFFIVDLEQPGVEIRPIRQMTGGQDFCEIFLSDAVVEDRDVLGSPTEGWRAAMTTFGFERGALVSPKRYERVADSLVELARELGRGDDPLVRQAVAQAKIEAHTFRMNQLRALTRYQQGAAPGPEASLTKLFWSEMHRRMQETATSIQGPYAGLERGAEWSIDGGLWQDSWMWSFAETIYAGTSEIQRNIIAERVLGLPRGR